jgi:hypothetical protein
MDPMKFVDSLDTKKHVVLVYDDQSFGKMIQFRFINNGLMKGENCIYLTHEDPKIIKKEMDETGIDVKEFVQKDLLHIQQISSPEKDPKGILIGYENIIKQATADKKPPYRIVGRIMPNIGKEVEMSVEIAIERMTHATFENLNSTVLCEYDFNEIPTKDHKMWLGRLCSHHHAAIVSTRSGMSMAGYL